MNTYDNIANIVNLFKNKSNPVFETSNLCSNNHSILKLNIMINIILYDKINVFFFLNVFLICMRFTEINTSETSCRQNIITPKHHMTHVHLQL